MNAERKHQKRLEKRKAIYQQLIAESFGEFAKKVYKAGRGDKSMLKIDVARMMLAMCGIKTDEDKLKQVFHRGLPEMITARKMLHLLEIYGKLIEYQRDAQSVSSSSSSDGGVKNIVVYDPVDHSVHVIRGVDEPGGATKVLDEVRQTYNEAIVCSTWDQLERRYKEDLSTSLH